MSKAPVKFSLSDPQMRVVFKLLHQAGKTETDVAVNEWESIAQKLNLQPQFGQIVKATYMHRVKEMKDTFANLREEATKENVQSNLTSKDRSRASSKDAKKVKMKEKSSKNSSRQEVESEDEDDPDDLSTLQTQAPAVANEEDETEEEEDSATEGFDSDPEQMEVDNEVKKAVSPEKQPNKMPVERIQREEPTNVPVAKPSTYREDPKQLERKRKSAPRTKAGIGEWIDGKSLKILGMKKNFPRGLVWKVVDRVSGEEQWMENRFLKYFYPDLLFEYYEERIVFE